MHILKNVSILISHIPNPRILKRVRSLESEFKISLIFWDRGQIEKETFEIDPINKVIKIRIDAPLGNPLKRISPLINFAFKALNVLKNSNPNIIHAANIDMLFISIIYKKIFNKKVKIVYEVADLPKYAFYESVDTFRSLIAKIMQCIEKNLTKDISMLILTSSFFGEQYFHKFIEKEKLIIIPNVPYKNLFNRYIKQKHNKFTIGFIGSIRYVNQLTMLIDVIEKLDKGIGVFIAGSGPGYEKVLNYSKEKDFVEFYGPYNYEKEIIGLYESIDCVYSVYDTNFLNVRIALPNRLYEAIACSLPIIGAEGTMLGKFIDEYKIGFTVGSNDNEKLKNELIGLIGSKDRIRYYQENCDKIKDGFFYEKISKKLVTEYKKL